MNASPATAPFRFQRLAYVALGVTNFARSIPFYRDVVGLDLTEADDRVAYFRCSPDHHNVVLIASPEPTLERIAFELETENDVSAAFEHVTQLGLDPNWIDATESAALKQGPTFRFTVPVLGATFEFFAGIRTLPQGFAKRLTSIERLGHVVVSTPRMLDVRAYLVEHLNFRVSDDVGDVVSFMRCHPNRFHHSFAMLRTEHARPNHVNFMVRDIDDVGRALNRMQAMNVPIVYGPGRHPPSNSIFLYFLDPDGLTLEYSFGMEEFPEEGARDARQMPMGPYALDYWGGTIDPRMGAVGRFATRETSAV